MQACVRAPAGDYWVLSASPAADLRSRLQGRRLRWQDQALQRLGGQSEGVRAAAQAVHGRAIAVVRGRSAANGRLQGQELVGHLRLHPSSRRERRLSQLGTACRNTVQAGRVKVLEQRGPGPDTCLCALHE
jgi:hypothetical protein